MAMADMTRGFGPGTMIDTKTGPVPIEWLSPSDTLLTREGALASPLDVLRSDGAGSWVALDPAAFGASPNHQPLITSGTQAVLLEGCDLALHFGLQVAFAKTDALLGHPGLSVPNAPPEHRFTLVTKQPTTIRANGVWVEPVSRDTNAPPAYPCLKSWEAALLMQLRGQRGLDPLTAVA